MSFTTRSLLGSMYGGSCDDLDGRLENVMNRYREHVSTPDEYRDRRFPFDERTVILTGGAEAFCGEADGPLGHLLRFLDEEADGVIGGVCLPGAAATDWPDDLEALAEEFDITLDLEFGPALDDPQKLLDLVERFLSLIAVGAGSVRLLTGGEEPAVRLLEAVAREVTPWVTLIGENAKLRYDEELAARAVDAVARGDTARLQEWVAAWPQSVGEGGTLPLLGLEWPDEPGSSTTFPRMASPALPDLQRAAILLAAHGIVLALAGIPVICCHALIGSDTVDRHAYDELSAELNDPDSLRFHVFEGLKNMLRVRAEAAAFHPLSRQQVLPAAPEILAVLRSEESGGERMLCLVNVSDHEAEVSFTDGMLGLGDEKGFRDILSGDYVYPSRDDGNRVSLELEPCEVLWLRY